MTKLSDLIRFSESRWPLGFAADWDNPGLAIGDRESRLTRVLLAVDVTSEVIEEAVLGQFDLVFTHHPFIFRGLKTLSSEQSKGRVATTCIRNNIALYSAHTNADFCAGGVSETLAVTLGLKNLRPLTTAGEGVVGELATTTLLDFARFAARALPSCAQGLLVQGNPEKPISTVGLVAGAGDSYLDSASDLDLFITSDLRHHPAGDFAERAGEVALMNIPHFSAEWPWLNQAALELKNQFPSVEFVVSEINTDPWNFAVMQ